MNQRLADQLRADSVVRLRVVVATVADAVAEAMVASPTGAARKVDSRDAEPLAAETIPFESP